MVENFVKKHKVAVVFVIVIALFFVFMNVDHMVEVRNLKKQYESDIEKLREMIPEHTEVDNDTACDEYVNNWMQYYFGVKEGITNEYRDEQLKLLMTDDCLFENYPEYDGDYRYETRVNEIRIFYSDVTDTKKRICILFEKDVIWDNIDPLTSRWYMTGAIVFEDGAWKISEITECDELVTREEYNILLPDTNGGNE